MHAWLLQGLAGWVGLKSRRGEPVGAVQLKVSLTQLEGRHVFIPRYLLHACHLLLDMITHCYALQCVL